MVPLHSHSRVGGNNTAHFEPETIYIVTVGVVPSQPSGVVPHRHTHARNHAHTHTHIAVLLKETDFVYLSGGVGCGPYCC